MPSLGPILLTGAAGRIGSELRGPLREVASELRLTDIAPLEADAPNETVHQADLADFDALRAAADGVESVVHLGGIPVEAPFEELAAANLVGCYHAYEAARLGGSGRFVFASSNHASGYYPTGHHLVGTEPPRPGHVVRGDQGLRRGARPALPREVRDARRLPTDRLVPGAPDRPTDAAPPGSACPTPCSSCSPA